MKIYTIKARGHYGGGMAVVAADDLDEAIASAATIQDTTWHTRYGHPDEVTVIGVMAEAKNPIRGVLDHFETGE